MAYPVSVEWTERDSATATSESELDELLDRLTDAANREHPPLVLINNEAGALSIGLGESVTVLCHLPPDSDPPYHISLGDAKAQGTIDFYYFGHHSEFHRRNTIPIGLARRVVREYASEGKLSERIVWTE